MPFDCFDFLNRLDTEPDMEWTERVRGYQQMIDSGTIWYLASPYRREARWLIAEGYCTLPWRVDHENN